MRDNKSFITFAIKWEKSSNIEIIFFCSEECTISDIKNLFPPSTSCIITGMRMPITYPPLNGYMKYQGILLIFLILSFEKWKCMTGYGKNGLPIFDSNPLAGNHSSRYVAVLREFLFSNQSSVVFVSIVGSRSIPMSVRTVLDDLSWFPTWMALNVFLQLWRKMMESKSRNELPEWVIFLRKAIETEKERRKRDTDGTKDRLEDI
jgi:hypothetical protein